VLVPIKRVIDYAAKVRVSPDNTCVDLSNVKMAMNPFCENAIEEAIRLKEAGHACEVTAVTVGPKQATDILRTALAMGADKAIHVHTDLRHDTELLPLSVAKILKEIVLKHSFNFVVCGKLAIDDDCNQTGQMLAGLLNWPQATFLNKLQISNGVCTATREVDGGLQVIEFEPPAVVTCDLRVNSPRFTAIPAIMKAKKKPIEELTPEALGVDIRAKYNTLSVNSPPKRKGGIMVSSVDELIEKLKNEAKII
jgi:electron transfer flavoprotein beta subunit